MNLVACSSCSDRFYVAVGEASEGRHCPQCGGGLDLASYDIKSIPLDARWLDPAATGDDAPEVTIVDLRRKRKRTNRMDRRIVRDLGDYFHVSASGLSVKVSVNRGAQAEAALRVAAVLDGVEARWEDHFYLPTAESEDQPEDLRAPALRQRGHVRLVASRGERIQSEPSA